VQFAASLIVPTYNAPRQLELVLTGLVRQSKQPFEIVIADDGSTEETAALVQQWQDGRLRVPLRHVWHEHLGFRRSTILNRAVSEAKGDYLIFLDGDSIPHRRFVADHLFSATRGRALCGRRVRLGPELSPTITPAKVAAGELEGIVSPVRASSARGDSSHWGRGIHLPLWFAVILRLRGRKLMGCNFSLPRAIFEAVNGLDEDFVGFGGEDFEFDMRCRNFGTHMTPLINRGIIYHLYHPVKHMSDEMRRMRDEKVSRKLVACEAGLNRHVEFDAVAR